LTEFVQISFLEEHHVPENLVNKLAIIIFYLDFQQMRLTINILQKCAVLYSDDSKLWV